MKEHSGLDNNAVTLVEILISMMILSLMISGLTGLFITSKRHIMHNYAMTEMGLLGRMFSNRLFARELIASTWDSGNCVSSLGVDTDCDTSPFPVGHISYVPKYTKSAIDAGPGGANFRKVVIELTPQ